MFKVTTNDTEEQTPEIEQSLDELAREGARRMILAALEVEVEPAPADLFTHTPSVFAASDVSIHKI